MKILITGASGFLGYHFALHACRAGHQLLCLHRRLSKRPQALLNQADIDWLDYADEHFAERVESFAPEVLMHAAWDGVRGKKRDEELVQSANIEFSRSVLTMYPFRQVIALGSQAEYGTYDERVSEETPPCPVTPYGRAKTICCRIFREYCESHGIEWQWIRVFTVFGPHQTGGLIKTAFESMKNGGGDFLTTEGMQRYSYLYAADYAEAMLRMIGSKGKSGIYNLSQPHCIRSNREILEMVKQLTGSTIKLCFGAIPYPEGQVMLMDGSVSKFEENFGKISCADFAESLRETIDDLGRRYE